MHRERGSTGSGDLGQQRRASANERVPRSARGADAAFLESQTPNPENPVRDLRGGRKDLGARAWSPRRLGTAGSGRVAATAYLDTHGSIVDVRLTAHDEGGGVLGAWRCAPSPQRRAALCSASRNRRPRVEVLCERRLDDARSGRSTPAVTARGGAHRRGPSTRRCPPRRKATAMMRRRRVPRTWTPRCGPS